MAEPYYPTLRTIQNYTEGDCWLLAHEMHKITGKPMAFANPYADDLGYWEHVGLQVSKNKILDILGISTPKAWREKWATVRYRSTTIGGVLYYTADALQIDELLMDQQPELVRRSDAKRVAIRLLETYAPKLL